MTDLVQLGDIGIPITLTLTNSAGTVIDVSSADTKDILISPRGGGSTKTNSASFVTNGTDGQLTYSTQSGDLDMTGMWDAQAHVTLPDSSDWRTTLHPFEVGRNL